MSEHPDRRGGLRAPIELSVEYKRLNTFFADYTRNISKGGTFIRTERPLPKGTELAFALTIRELPEPMRLKGRVVWTVAAEEQSDEQPAGMGIEFVYDTDDERTRVETLVERLMGEHLGEHLSTRLLGRRG